MNKKKILLSLVTVSTVFASASAIYAFTSKIDLANLTSNYLKENEQNEVYIGISEKDTTISNPEKEDIIQKANTYIPTLIGETTTQTARISENNSSEIKLFHDNTINEDYYDIVTSNYTISMDKNSKLRAFSDDTFNYDLQTTSDKSIAKTFITNFYNNLDISHDYELEYLERFDDSMWEADFVKKLDGLYNYYDSIKIFFSPEQQKIAALRIHSTSYDNDGIATLSENITEAEAKNIVKEQFENISDNQITNIELTYIKPNNFFTRQAGSDIISSNVVVKAWKVTIEQDATTTFVFVDFSTGNILGGDQVK